MKALVVNALSRGFDFENVGIELSTDLLDGEKVDAIIAFCSSTSNRSSRHWSASSVTSRISILEHGLCACSGYPLQHARSPLMHSESTATQEALRAVFCTQLQRLHLQAYVLTGCPKLAVDCVLDAFDMVSDSFVASPEFAYEASRLATIKSGLQRVLPEIKQHALNESTKADRPLPISSGNETTISRETFLASLHRLDVFHRAVLLLCLYEGYRAHEASLLLRLPRNTIQQGMVDALLALVSSLTGTDADDLPCEGYFAASTTDAEYRANHNSRAHPAAAATWARSH